MSLELQLEQILASLSNYAIQFDDFLLEFMLVIMYGFNQMNTFIPLIPYQFVNS